LSSQSRVTARPVASYQHWPFGRPWYSRPWQGMEAQEAQWKAFGIFCIYFILSIRFFDFFSITWDKDFRKGCKTKAASHKLRCRTNFVVHSMSS
jgi:hypothetical protein